MKRRINFYRFHRWWAEWWPMICASVAFVLIFSFMAFGAVELDSARQLETNHNIQKNREAIRKGCLHSGIDKLFLANEGTETIVVCKDGSHYSLVVIP